MKWTINSYIEINALASSFETERTDSNIFKIKEMVLANKTILQNQYWHFRQAMEEVNFSLFKDLFDSVEEARETSWEMPIAYGRLVGIEGNTDTIWLLESQIVYLNNYTCSPSFDLQWNNNLKMWIKVFNWRNVI